jgi:hypothetical protein
MTRGAPALELELLELGLESKLLLELLELDKLELLELDELELLELLGISSLSST